MLFEQAISHRKSLAALSGCIIALSGAVTIGSQQDIRNSLHFGLFMVAESVNPGNTDLGDLGEAPLTNLLEQPQL